MKQPQTLLNKETCLFHPVFSSLIVGLVSGFVIYLNETTDWWSQLNILGHIFIGILFAMLSLPYLFIHFKRTLGIRQPVVTLSGLLLALIIIGFIYTGLYLAIAGHHESGRFYLDLHLYGSVLLMLLLVPHLLLHRLAKTRKDGNRFHTLKTYSYARGIRAVMAYSLVVGLTTMIYSFYYAGPEIEAVAGNYLYDYGNQPFRPSQTETPGNDFVAVTEIAGSASCAQCHAEIARQWSGSLHRQAASDPAYVTNILLLEKNKGISSTRYCEGCHAPVALLTGQLTPGGSHGGIADTVANQEGVSCLSCHRITRAVHLDGVASYHFAPAEEYLFQRADNAMLKKINRYLIKVSARQHRKDLAQPILSQPTHCATCHAQFMDKSMNDWGWVKMQDDYSAWLNSPYSRQHQQNFANEQVQRCQDCHMPLVKAADPSADAAGRVRSHRFAAANTMLAYLNNDTVQLEETINFLRTNKMNITIEPPNRKSATQSTLNLEQSLRQNRETPTYHYLGETLQLNLVISNTGVGHDFPAGTIDINEAWVSLVVRDVEGRTIFQSGDVNENDELDQSAHSYLSIPVNRQGKAVWRHDLFNMIGETFRNVIRAGESDLASYTFEIPFWAKGPLIIDASLKYRKLNTRYAKWSLKDRYKPLPIVDMARDSLIVELRHEPEISPN